MPVYPSSKPSALNALRKAIDRACLDAQTDGVFLPDIRAAIDQKLSAITIEEYEWRLRASTTPAQPAHKDSFLSKLARLHR